MFTIVEAVVLLIVNFALLNYLKRLMEGLELNRTTGFLDCLKGGHCMHGVALDNMQRTIFFFLFYLFFKVEVFGFFGDTLGAGFS